ncbi:amidohydrolase family protein [Staphylococcus carnosus]|uniref:amidohydrolase family protein n=1 Tax=Staphylococcus carnosus TaxID=1281 RepID=UPI0020A4ED9B|nr:amidohydrolase family protein [Staphylococcus carnosus]UTB79886.1 2-pyrone-4,6-dicarboxylate hydrolase [Staphylococcus carnosus]
MKLFDSHFHIIDYNYPIIENQGYLPPNYSVQNYKKDTKNLNIVGGTVVSGSFQGFDQQYLTNALNKLVKNFYGVTQLPIEVSNQEILALKRKRVTAVRFNIQRGGIESLKNLRYFSERIYELAGWHTELYLNAKTLTQIKDTLKSLPLVSIDHLGLSKEGLPTLLDLVDHGVHVKATGFSRGDLDVADTMKQIYNINPDALMFGTDLPSTRAPRPFSKKDIQLIQESFDEQACENIFYRNALNWYQKKQ